MKASDKSIIIAGYIRVSSPQQVREGESLADQRKSIEKYAQAHGYKIFKIYADEGIGKAGASI